MTWLITAPPGNVITVNFNNFNIEPIRDSMVIYDGIMEYIRNHGVYYRGNTGPGNVTSSSNNLLVRFVTDDYTQRGGFSATFEFEGNNTFANS